MAQYTFLLPKSISIIYLYKISLYTVEMGTETRMVVGTALLNITRSDTLSKLSLKLILLLLCDFFGLVTMKAAGRESGHHLRKSINTNHKKR